MRIAWAVVCLIATIVVAHLLMFASSPPSPHGAVSLGLVLQANWPPALAVLAVSLLVAAAIGRLDGAVRAAVILAVLSLLLAVSRTFWLVANPEAAWAEGHRSITEFFFPPLWGVALGGLFLESLRRRSARRRGELLEPAVSDAWLLLCVPLAGLLTMLTVMNWD